MRRQFFALLLLAASCIGWAQAIDFGWDLKVDPLGTRDVRQGKSVAKGFQGLIHFASEVRSDANEFRTYIELRRTNNDGVEQGSPVVLAHADWDYTNPQLFLTDPESNDITVVYERVHPTTGEHWLAWAQIDAGGTILRDEAVSQILNLGKVQYRAVERAIYALTTEQYFQTFTYVRLYRFVDSGFTMPVSSTRQEDETGVDFTFDPNGDVYIGSNSRTGQYTFPFGRITKRVRTSTPWPFAWERDMRVNSTSALQVGAVAYAGSSQRIAVSATYNASNNDGRPSVLFCKTDNSAAGWWWWGRPPDSSTIELNQVVASAGRVRMAGHTLLAGTLSRRWMYMDLDENTGYAYWWYSELGSSARVNSLVLTSRGETLSGMADPHSPVHRWFAAMPRPGVALNELFYEPEGTFSGTLNGLAETNDEDAVGVGTLGRSSIFTRILLAPIANPDTFENLKEGRTFASNRSVLSNDYRKTNATAAVIGDGTTSQGGSVTMAEDGFFSYQPPPGFYGTDSFSYKAYRAGTNRILESAAATVQLQVAANRDPVAQNDVFTVIQGANKILPVLNNDSDADGDPLVVDSVLAPSHGTAWIEGGEVHYRSIATYTGPDSFIYTIADDLGNRSRATVYINVVLKPVYLKSLAPTSAQAGSPDVTLTLSGSNFVHGSKVFADEAELGTTFVSTTELRAILPAAMLALEASYSISVRNPNGAVSAAKTFKVIGKAQIRFVVVKVERLDGHLVVSMKLRNVGTGSTKPQTVVAADLQSQPTNDSLPVDLGIIAPGAEVDFQLRFPDLPSGTLATLTVNIQNGTSIVKQYTKEIQAP